jgi:hypothetical protein
MITHAKVVRRSNLGERQVRISIIQCPLVMTPTRKQCQDRSPEAIVAHVMLPTVPNVDRIVRKWWTRAGDRRLTLNIRKPVLFELACSLGYFSAFCCSLFWLSINPCT